MNKLVLNESGFIGSNYPEWIHKLIELVRKLLSTSLCMCGYNLNNIIIKIFKMVYHPNMCAFRYRNIFGK